MWCVPELNEEFIGRMEDILALYERPYNAQEPVVCLDEKPVQCLDDKRRTVRVKNGSVRRDYEYIRRGTVNVFCAVEPKTGRHFAKPTENRKLLEIGRMLRDIARAYPHARTIHLVMDNLRGHSVTSLEHAFGEEAGRKLWSRFTPHYTPKHASWLNQAEIQISLFASQCLGKRRIGSLPELCSEARAWRRRVTRAQVKINWKFTVTDARRKFGYRRKGRRINLSRN
jgi:hypothetical protein